MTIGLLLLTFLSLKETQHLRKVHTIMENLLVVMATNDMNVVVIIFALTIIDSKTLIPEAIVDMEDMVGLVLFLV